MELVSGQRLTRVGARDETTWWLWDEDSGLADGAATVARGTVRFPRFLDPPFLTPARLIAILRFRVAGQGVRAARDVVLAEATPRDMPPGCHSLRYHFEFDKEHGTPLRRAMFVAGECVEVTEALEVNYGGELNERLFHFELPDDAGRLANPLRVAHFPERMSAQ